MLEDCRSDYLQSTKQMKSGMLIISGSHIFIHILMKTEEQVLLWRLLRLIAKEKIRISENS